ncbi:hypothetical protein Fmac_000765 [Flemingia macrophylla]|uniref:2-oxoglutarate-dependent dioxygenase DAO n=1 Tax=Flemingia macrophylla TaxID=520843 RepID=A0ABD1NF66_9FABA
MSKKVREACENHGYFLLTCDEIIPKGLNQEFFKRMEELFYLPEETKKQHKSTTVFSSYDVNPLFQSFGLDEVPLSDIAQTFTNLMWPQGNPSFCETLKSMSLKMVKLSSMVMKMIKEGYDLPQHYNSEIENMKISSNSRLIRYKVPKDKNNSETALVMHTDKNALTIFCENEVQGLQVLSKTCKWIDVKLPQDGFVVIIGEILKAWSNARLHAVPHRVVMSGEKERYTLILFTRPKEEMKIVVPHELVDEKTNPLRYRPFKYGDYFSYFTSNPLKPDALEAFAVLLKLVDQLKYSNMNNNHLPMEGSSNFNNIVSEISNLRVSSPSDQLWDGDHDEAEPVDTVGPSQDEKTSAAVLWYTDSLTQKATLEGHSSLITDVRFSPSMVHLATSSFDKTIRIWDVENPVYSYRIFTGHSAAAMTVDFHPKIDDLVCSCDGYGEIRYWSINNGNCARVFGGGNTQFLLGGINSLHERFAVLIETRSLYIFSGYHRDSEGHRRPVYCVCWDPSGEFLASVSEDSVKSLELWNMRENKTMTVPAHDGLIAALAVSTVNGLVASASHDNCAREGDAEEGGGGVATVVGGAGERVGLARRCWSKEPPAVVLGYARWGDAEEGDGSVAAVVGGAGDAVVWWKDAVAIRSLEGCGCLVVEGE